MPIHLRRPLPKYRLNGQGFTTSEPRYQNNPEFAYTFQPSGVTTKLIQRKPNSPEYSRNFAPVSQNAAPFKPSILIDSAKPSSPSPHGPNYSHLYSQQHIRDPSQTETFLGQITIQSPADLPPEFNNRGFRPSLEFPLPPNKPPFDPHKPPLIDKNNELASSHDFHRTNFDYNEKPFSQNTVQLGNGARGNFLNHRTRIFAPSDGSAKQEKANAKEYFINANGDVYSTTRVPFSAPKDSFEVAAKKDFEPTKPSAISKKPTTENLHFASLLEDPISSNDNANRDDDDVEVIKSVTVPPDQFYTIAGDPTTVHAETAEEEIEEETSTTEDPNSLDGLDYENETTAEEHEEHEEHEDLEDNETVDEAETTTLKPLELELEEDATHEEEAELTTVGEEEEVSTQSVETTTITHNETGESVLTNETDSSAKDAVVSVVTTKSVINNTMIVTATPSPPVTEQMYSPDSEEDELTTDSWIVIASVQTSRSVSGARYLPSSIVEQEQRTKYLNERESNQSLVGEPTIKNLTSSTNKPNTSTESLTDKLDRQQSDLSSDLLTGGLNDIPVLKEAAHDKQEQETTTHVPETTTTVTPRSTSLPPVVIRKFSPNARRTTTKRPRRIFDAAKKDDLVGLLPAGYKPRYQNNRRTASTTAISVDSLNLPQGDEPVRATSQNAQEELRSTNQSATIDKILAKARPADISALLPPGYKPSSTTTTKPQPLDKILEKVAPVSDISAFLPPGYKFSTTTTQKPKAVDKILEIAQPVDIAAFLPPGYKPPSTTATPKPVDKILEQAEPVDVSAFLPAGYKKPTDKPKTIDKILEKAEPEDVSAFLPPGYKTSTTTTQKPKSVDSILRKAEPVNVDAFLPPGYKSSAANKTKTMQTAVDAKKNSSTVKSVLDNATPVNISSLLPPGFKLPKGSKSNVETIVDDVSALLPPGYTSRFKTPKFTTAKPDSSSSATTEDPQKNVPSTTVSSSNSSSNSGSGFKVVFPSRPGGTVRKSSKRLTTPKPLNVDGPVVTPPSIQKGWPSR